MESTFNITPPVSEEEDPITAYSFGGTPVGPPREENTTVTPVARPEDYRTYSTTGELLEQVPIGVVEGALKATPTAAGTLMGLGIGLKVAPFTGPFAPVAVVLGGVGGAVAGMMGEDAITALTDKYSIFPEAVRPDERAIREGSKTAGSFIPFAGGARFLPEALDNWASRLVSSFGKGARENPKLFYSIEAMGAAGSGAGGAVAESAYPGDPLAKFALEFGGGAFFPFRTVVSNFNEAKNAKQSFKELFGQGKAEARAARRLEAIFNDPYVMETFKEDPQKILAALRSPEITGLPAGVSATAAQKSGSAVLSAFEASLARQNAQFGGDVESKGRAYLMAHKELVNNLTQTQDPNALLLAAKFQSDYFRDLIAMRLKLAQSKIDPLPKGLTPDSPEYATAIGNSLKNSVQQAIKDMRAFEKDLYAKAKSAGYKELTNADLTRLGVPKDQWAATRAKMVTPKQRKASSLIYEALSQFEDRGFSDGADIFSPRTLNKLKQLGIDEELINTYNGATLTKEFRDTGVLPEAIKKAIDKKIGLISPSQIQTLRSDLLDDARKAAAGQERGDANAYGRLAQAALSDLEAFNIPEYKEALTFSKVLNDHFTRAFPVEINATKRSGADRIPPELLANNFFNTLAATGDKTALRMRELEGAVELAAWAKAVDNPSQAAATRDQWAQAVRDNDAATLRRLKPLADQVKQNSLVLSVDDAFKKIFEQDINKLFTPTNVEFIPGRPTTRLEFNVNRYQNFLQQNDAILKRFHPVLYEDLQNVNKAEQYFRSLQDSTSALNRSLNDKAAFAAVLRSPENVTRVVSDAFNSGDPVTQLQRLIDLTKNKKVIQGTGLGDSPKRGLASSFYDWAFLKAANEPAGPARDTAAFDPTRFKSAMFSPIKPGMPSLSEMMVKNGLADVAEMARLKKITDTIQRTQESMGTRQFVQTLTNINPLEDLAIRLAGTQAASRVAPSGPGSIVAAGAAVRTFKQLFENMPLGQTRAVLERAAKDPELMASLLERGKAYDQRSFFNIGKRVLQSMQRNGITPFSVATTNYFDQANPPMTNEEAIEMLTSPTTGVPAAQLLRQLPPAPPTKGLPGIITPPKSAPAQGSGPRVPTQSSIQGPLEGNTSRQMLQSLFPFDSTLRVGVPPAAQ
jgi:hypothetical protein